MIKSTVYNTLDENYFNMLKATLAGPSFPWYYTEYTAYPQNHIMAGEKEWGFSFFHSLSKDGQPCSNFFDLFYPSVLQMLSKHDVNARDVYIKRIRLGLITKGISGVIDGYDPHVDFQDQHDTYLFYFDNSDGDTIIYNELFENDIPKNVNLLTIDQRVKPEQNKSVRIDGLTYHAGSMPVNHKTRIVMNINVY
jgi:hypothetical protein